MYRKVITDDMIFHLRQDIRQCMSQSRYEHTLGVEAMAIYIGQACCIDDLNQISAAALLHDITKEYSFTKQLKICEEFGIILKDDEKSSPAIIHAITAAAIIPVYYPEFNDDEIISCVRWHTTGKRDMSLCEKIIYLSDYIEHTRMYDLCAMLRDEFCTNFNTSDSIDGKLKAIDTAVIKVLEHTVEYLHQKNVPVNSNTSEALSYMKTELV